MIRYNWEQKDWPNFTYSLTKVEKQLSRFLEMAGHNSGMLKGLPENIKTETLIDLMVAEAIKTSEIEGEFFSRADVMSSIKNNLGFIKDAVKIKDKNAEGIAKLIVDTKQTFKEKLHKKKLFEWQTMVMGSNKSVKIGAWRSHEEPMQVVSGAIGKIKIHFEAPPSKIISKEMDRFIKWFNETAPGAKNEISKPPLRAAIAHLYFESLHPFEDGNGRVGRAIAEKALSQGIDRLVMLSLSRTFEANKKDYYKALENGQRKNEITEWVNYFIQTVLDAQIEAGEQINFTLKKVQFFDRYKLKLNDRQLKVIKKMFEEGYKGFKGGMNATKYVSIAKISKATATRDLQYLLENKMFKTTGASGRSTSYELAL
jgi:Fic family protein